MSQMQASATKSWPSVFGAQQGVVVGEVGLNWFHNLPSDVKFSGPATYLPATQFGAALTAGGGRPKGGDPPHLSWGYRPFRRPPYPHPVMGGTASPPVAATKHPESGGPRPN